MKTAPPQKELTHWPPYQYASRHRVLSTDSWASLAQQFGRQDPWDIIQFNFETKVPEIVNHYMQTLVGCTGSKDGKNYSFSGADQPGYIYIPPKYWKPAMGPYLYDDWKVQVLSVLDHWVIDHVPHLNRAGIVDLIKNKIQVTEYANVGVPYEYGYRDELFARRLGHMEFADSAWLVKEAVHIWNGPYGWNDGGGYLKNEVNGWIALAAWFELIAPAQDLSDLFYFIKVDEGHFQKVNCFAAAREYWQKYKHKQYPSPTKFEIERAVRRDPSFARRAYVYQQRAA